jgi:hypothetical protein
MSPRYGRTVAWGTGSFRTNGAACCLGCLARHPEATFADRLKSHRLAAGASPAPLNRSAQKKTPRSGLISGVGHGLRRL